MSPTPELVSYAQNFEDVMLWRALAHVKGGRYVDVGAQDPVVDSVSRLFYDHGWRGIHIEPSPLYAQSLREARPDEVVLQAAARSDQGSVRFFEFPGTGLSTCEAAIAERHRKAGLEGRELVVPGVTLDEIFASNPGSEFHWLKVDVEGAEADVLRGWTSAARPWVAVVEGIGPFGRAATHRSWEPMLLRKGYKFAYFDGLNRFYVAPGREQLAAAFAPGPNVFDGFALSGTSTSPFCSRVNDQLREACARNDFLERDNATRAARAAAATEEIAALARELVSREREFSQQLWETRASEHAHAQREQELAVRLGETVEAIRREADQARAQFQNQTALRAGLEHQLRASQDQSRLLAQRLAERERELALALRSARDQAERNAAEASTLASRVTELEAALGAAQGAIGERDASVARMRATIDTLNEEVARARAAAGERSQKERILEGRLAALREARERELRARRVESRALAEEARRLESQGDRLDHAHLSFARQLDGLVHAQGDARRAIEASVAQFQVEMRAARIGRPPPAGAPPAPGTPAPTLDSLLALQGRDFVKCAFLTLLGREPDPEGMEYYAGRLRAGVAGVHLLGQIAASREAREKGVRLEGLEAALRRYRLARLLPFRGFAARVMGTEPDTNDGRVSRALAQGAHVVCQDARAQFARIDDSIENLRRVEGLRRKQAQALAQLASTVAELALPEEFASPPVQLASMPEHARRVLQRLRGRPAAQEAA